MFEFVALHVMVAVTVATSVVGAVCILRGVKIFDLKTGTRNLLYAGACCAMCFGFLGATVCAELITKTQWHYMAAPLLAVVGAVATAHITVDLSDRLRIVKRS